MEEGTIHFHERQFFRTSQNCTKSNVKYNLKINYNFYWTQIWVGGEVCGWQTFFIQSQKLSSKNNEQIFLYKLKKKKLLDIAGFETKDSFFINFMDYLWKK